MKPTKQVLVVLFLNLFAGVYSSGDTVIEYTKGMKRLVKNDIN